MKYQVARGNGDTLTKAVDALKEEVEFWIKEGYVPEGGICAFPSGKYWFEAIQAMIKE